jgi:protein-tyrosine phosphatase
VIDLHSHILPGIDDGAKSLDESVEIALAAVADGVEVLAATPHVRDDYPTTADTMEALVGELRRALVREGVPLDVRKGGELALTWLDRLSDAELRRFGLGGNPGYLLVEFPYYGWPMRLPDSVFRLQTRGITLVIAHPERNADVQAAPEKLRPLVDAGALVQVTAASVDGRLGSKAKETGLDLVERGLAHVLASDAHHPSVRAGGMDAAFDAIGDEELARWLSRNVPEAIVTGRAIPARPARQRRRRFGIL